MLDIGRNQSETTASKTQGTLIHEGEQYAQEHYKQNTMGNILDIYEGVESIRENLNITQKYDSHLVMEQNGFGKNSTSRWSNS